MNRPQAFVKVVIAGLALFLFQRFEANIAKQLTFACSIVVILVETWFTDNVKRLAGKGERGGRPASRSSAPGWDWQPSPSLPPDRHGLGDAVSVLAAFIPLAVMADSFFFTTWLDLPPAAGPGGPGPGFIPVVVKFVASLLALGIAFVGPVVIGVFGYLGLLSWLERRIADRKAAAGKLDEPVTGVGCLALLPAVLVGLLAYGHFFLGHAFYDALGVLRNQ